MGPGVRSCCVLREIWRPSTSSSLFSTSSSPSILQLPAFAGGIRKCIHHLKTDLPTWGHRTSAHPKAGSTAGLPGCAMAAASGQAWQRGQSSRKASKWERHDKDHQNSSMSDLLGAERSWLLKWRQELPGVPQPPKCSPRLRAPP